MRLSPYLAVLGAAGALCLAAPAALAYADGVAPQPRAAGVFFYENVFSGSHRLTDPPSDRCLRIDGQTVAGPVTNRTDEVAIVFELPDCFGPSYTVRQEQTRDVPFPVFRSVLFLP